MAARNVEENIAEREVYRRRPPAENLYSGFPFQEAGQEQWHYATVLCGKQPRANHSPRPLYAGSGGDGAEGKPPQRGKEEETSL